MSESPVASVLGPRCCATCGYWGGIVNEYRRSKASQPIPPTWNRCNYLSGYERIAGRWATPERRHLMWTAPDFGCEAWQERLA